MLNKDAFGVVKHIHAAKPSNVNSSLPPLRGFSFVCIEEWCVDR